MSVNVYQLMQKQTAAEIVILADTSFGRWLFITFSFCLMKINFVLCQYFNFGDRFRFFCRLTSFYELWSVMLDSAGVYENKSSILDALIMLNSTANSSGMNGDIKLHFHCHFIVSDSPYIL